MADNKYVAYVGSYTHGKAKGITICDVDMEEGIFIPRKEVEVGNPSYLRIANNGKFLYSVSDLGISSFKILEDGDLEFMNLGSINGMRACHISVDKKDKFIYTAGYHDGKASVVRINDDGSVGELTAEDQICYAAKSNTLMIRADGTIGKCTVNFNDPRNNFGNISSYNWKESTLESFRYNDMNFDCNTCINCCLYPICFGIQCPARRKQACEKIYRKSLTILSKTKLDSPKLFL